LVAVDKGETNIERGMIYRRYLGDRLQGAEVNLARLTSFRLERMTRPHRGQAAPKSGLAQRIIPDAVLEGVLTVRDPVVFKETLANGIGRQRAYGRGYVRLEPTALDIAGARR
jgi:hypothetical protein